MTDRPSWATESPEAAAKRIRGRKGVDMRARVLNAEPLCRPCAKAGRTCVAVEVDHVTPLSRGGTNDLGNLQPICLQCHQDKSLRERGARPRLRINVDGWPE